MTSAKIQGELWGQAASDWTYIQEPTSSPLFEAMLDATNVAKDTRFFDVGCGGGGASILAAQRGAHVSGLDATKELIAIARNRIRSGHFLVGDIEQLPFGDNTFDVVFAANCIQYPENRQAALLELKRICAVNGQITISLFASPEKVKFRVMQEAIRNALPNPPSDWGPYELSAPGKLEALLAEAGLQIVQSGEVDCPKTFPDFATYWRGQISAGPTRRAMRAIGEDKLKTVLQEAIQAFRTDDGSFYIGPNFFRYVVATAT